MRNLRQYPITPDEEIRVLMGIRDQCMAEGRAGDMRPLILQKAIDRVQIPAPSQEEERHG